MNAAKIAAVVFVLALFSGLPSLAAAETQTITAEHTCVLGDNETKAQARKICYLEAKRKLLEKAGTIVVADTRIKDMQVQSDEVRTYALARMRIKVVEEEFFVRGENFAIRTIVSAEVDLEDFARTMELMRERPDSMGADRERALRSGRLEERALELRDRINAGDGYPVDPYLDEQRRIFRTLEEIEARQQAITGDISRTSGLAREFVRRGMTEAEVVSLLGDPRAVKESRNRPSTWRCLNYGNVWVVFRDGLVQCMRDGLRYNRRLDSDCHCEGFAGEVFGD